MPCLQPAPSGLPPALCPNPIRSAAPAPDRRAGLLGAFGVYLGLALSAWGVSHVTPRSLPFRPTRTESWDIRDFLEKTPPHRDALTALRKAGGVQTRPKDWVKPEQTDQVPDRPPDHLPEGRDPRSGLYREDMPIGDGALIPPGDKDGTPETPERRAPPAILDLGDQAPAILSRVDPVYPKLARAVRMEGTVELSILVDERGYPMEIQALGGPAAFVAESERAVRQWRFTPAYSNGTTCPARFRITVHFRLRA
jgi:protein TonB